LPEGIFSLLFDRGTEVGTALVKHARIKAVGFTGSRRAGRALMDLAAARPEPIPLFAEMSSTNPVFLLPGALRERGGDIAAGLHGSFTLGAGQFCTKPGMVFLPAEGNARQFKDKLGELINAAADYHLLTEGIRSSYLAEIAARQKQAALKSISSIQPSAESSLCVGAVLFETDAASFMRNTGLDNEIFGPSTLLVENCSREDLLLIAQRLGGHLTATIHGTDHDLNEFSDLVAVLQSKVGRLIFNGFPTGVEVSHAMVHGGPYPATSDGRSTSVGSGAIFRFARPVCYQGFPDEALPQELKDSNPLGIWRLVDGQITRDGLTRELVRRVG
jgi:NADP-dependent aldehyde dehydrogenase